MALSSQGSMRAAYLGQRKTVPAFTRKQKESDAMHLLPGRMSAGDLAQGADAVTSAGSAAARAASTRAIKRGVAIARIPIIDE
jgi:hypothetical protein